MRNPKKDRELSELEARVHAGRSAGMTSTALSRELNLSPTYVSNLYRVAARKLEAQAIWGTRKQRIDSIG